MSYMYFAGFRSSYRPPVVTPPYWQPSALVHDADGDYRGGTARSLVHRRPAAAAASRLALSLHLAMFVVLPAAILSRASGIL